MLLLLAMAVPVSAKTISGTDISPNQAGPITGTCYTLDANFAPSGISGSACYGNMGSDGGVKMRTNQDGNRVVFEVIAPYVVTKFTLEAYSNNTDATITATKVEVDGVETSFTGGSFPSKTTAQNLNESGNLTVSGISATESIVIYFDNSEVTGNNTENTGNKNKQICAYYELEWQKDVEETLSPLSEMYDDQSTATGWATSVAGDNPRFTPVILNDDGNYYLSVDQTTRNNNGCVVTGTILSGLVAAGDDFTLVFDMRLGNNNQGGVNVKFMDATNKDIMLSISAVSSGNDTSWAVNGSDTQVTLPNSYYNNNTTGAAIKNITWCTYQLSRSGNITYLTIINKETGATILERTKLTDTSLTGGLGNIVFTTGRYYANFAIDNIILRKLQEGDVPEGQTANYTIQYHNEAGAKIKDDLILSDLVGNEVEATEAQMAYIDIDDKRYLYKEGNQTIAIDTDEAKNVITLVFREAAVCQYSVFAKLGDSQKLVASGSSLEQSEIVYYYPEFILEGKSLYGTNPNSTNPHFGGQMTLNESNKTLYIDYTLLSQNAVYCSEAEDINGLTPQSGNNADMRCSYGRGGTLDSSEPVALTTLPAGKYTIFGQVWGSSGYTATITDGAKDLWSLSTVGSRSSSTATITLTETTTLYFSNTYGESNKGMLDCIYIYEDETYRNMVGYTERIVGKTLLGRSMVSDNENVSISNPFHGTNIDDRIGVSRTVYIDGVGYTNTNSWRKNVNGIYDNQNIGYTLTVAKGHKMNISNVNALIAVENYVGIFTWYVEILDGSSKQLWKSGELMTSASSSGVIDNVDVSEIEALQGLTGNITVNLYVKQEGSVKHFSINYLLLTINTETDNRPTYDMTITQNITEAGTVTPATGSWVADGESVAFTATPNEDYKFVKWTVDGTDYSSNPHIIENVTANHSAQVTFKKRYTVTYDLGEYGGCSDNILNNVNRSLGYDEKYSDDEDKYTIPHYAHKNLYREGYVFDKWRDNNGRTYSSGDVIAMTEDITLTPTWKATTASIKSSYSETVVNWSFYKKDILFCNLSTSQYNYYTQNAIVNGETIAIPMRMSGSKIFNSNFMASQLAKGVTFTIPAVSGMVVELSEEYVPESFSTTTIAGSTNYTKSDNGRTITYTYIGEDETIDIVINEENHYDFRYVKVYYPATLSDSEEVTKKLWDFTKGLSAETIANLNADADNWESNGTDAENNTNNWKNVTNQGTYCYWKANGEIIEELYGLKFDIGTYTSNSIHLATTKLRLTRANTVITFPKLKNGQTITIKGKSANKTATDPGLEPVQDYLQFQAGESSPQTDGKCMFLGQNVEGSEVDYTFVWKVVTESTDDVDVQFLLTGGGVDFKYFMIDNGDESDCILGDVNGNGGVDIGDAVSIVNYLVGKESTTFVEKAADTNKNGQIDIGDAVTIVNFLVGKTASLSRIIDDVWDEREPQ